MRKAEKRFIHLRNDQLEVTFCTLGASIYRIKYGDDDMLLTPKERKDYFHTFFYHGKTIGRLCGRIIKNDEVILHGGPAHLLLTHPAQPLTSAWATGDY